MIKHDFLAVQAEEPMTAPGEAPPPRRLTADAAGWSQRFPVFIWPEIPRAVWGAGPPVGRRALHGESIFKPRAAAVTRG